MIGNDEIKAEFVYGYDHGNPAWVEENPHITVVRRDKWINDRELVISEEFDEICEQEFGLTPYGEELYDAIDTSDSRSYTNKVYAGILEKLEADPRFERDDSITTFNPYWD